MGVLQGRHIGEIDLDGQGTKAVVTIGRFPTRTGHVAFTLRTLSGMSMEGRFQPHQARELAAFFETAAHEAAKLEM